MKSVIRWAINNTPAMNVVMVALLLVGAISGYMLRREEFPEFELEIILISVPYPGASPEEVESGVCMKVEEAVQSLDYIKKMTSIAGEGAGSVVLELESNVPDVQKVLNEVRSEIDRISSFPRLTEDPDVKQITMRKPAIRLGIIGYDDPSPDAEWRLRETAEKVRDDLLLLPAVTQVGINGAKNFQIDVEIKEETLRKHGLTLKSVADIIRKENIELPGGRLRTESQDVLLRGKNKRLSGKQIAEIPLITQSNGAVITIGDLGAVKDEFEDSTSIHRINGKPGLVISVSATAQEDLITITSQVKKYMETAQLPEGYTLKTWEDHSINVRDRLSLLTNNGLQGLILVFIVLAIFLEIRLAFWVAMGIPISVMATCAVLLYLGATLNMLSMFAFLMALGIVVDDAIVIGENIYAHRQLGKGFVEAAIDGTAEVVPSVIMSVTTTIIAFVPMMFVTGIMGKFFAILPIAMICMLAASLFESTFILPCHLGHPHKEVDGDKKVLGLIPRKFIPLRWILTSIAFAIAFGLSGAFGYQGDRTLLAAIVAAGFFCFSQLLSPTKNVQFVTGKINKLSSAALAFIINRGYLPLLKQAIRYPAITICAALGIFIVSLGAVNGGIVPWVFFPKLDSNTILAKVTFLDGTPSKRTLAATENIAAAMERLNQKYTDRNEPIVRVVYQSVGFITSDDSKSQNDRTNGGHMGMIRVELVDTQFRNVKSQKIIDEWRTETGEIPGVESLQFNSASMGPGGKSIEFKLLSDSTHMPELEQAVEACKTRLSNYPGVFDVADDSHPGKWEFQLTKKKAAQAMGLTLSDMAEPVRAAYYGEEVMRLQRGRHEVKLMVRYPSADRHSLADFENIRIRSEDGIERPLTELADVKVERGYSEINRIDQKRSITVMADVDETMQTESGGLANATEIISNFKQTFLADYLKDHPELYVRWEGQAEQSRESVSSLFFGFGIAMIAMYVLLTVEFRSYLQPLIVLMIIPFGTIGAIFGHALMGLPLTLFSVLGLVALSGVVVNDSIVLMDFINMRIKEGIGLQDALLQAGQRRFRPVLLTSITTVAGLLPILVEKSFQAQILIPMAVSISFGLMLATVLVLILVPTLYFVYGRYAGLQMKTVIASSETTVTTEEDVTPAHATIQHNDNGASHSEEQAVPTEVGSTE